LVEFAVAISAWTRDLITSLIAAWIIIGIYIDGWAHVNLLDRIESFFTPWHAIFYTGLLAFGVWIGLLLLTVRRPGDRPQAVFGRLPLGYKAGAIGGAIFAVGGAVDMLWHTLIGIETSIDALLSPPHLVLLSGVLLMATTAWRSQRAVSPTMTIPELISLASVVAISAFFLNYLSPFRWAAPTLQFSQYENEDLVIMWIGGVLVSTALLLIPLLWQLRDGRYRVGTLSVFVFATGLAITYAMSEGWPKDLLLAGVAGATIGAIAAEVLLDRLPWRGWRYGLPLMMAAAAFIVWSGQLAGYGIAGVIRWPATLWLGTLLLAAGAGAAIGAVLWPAPAPAQDARDEKLPAAEREPQEALP
jgi:hypothetical protein